MDKQNQKGKIIYLEVLRVIALLFVFYAHSGENGLQFYQHTDNAILQGIGIFLAGICQLSVPVFFLISGALLLRKEESIGKIYLHRVLPMAVITVLAVAAQYLYMGFVHGLTLSFRSFTELLYSGGAITQQWFLFAYLSFLVILPFLQKLTGAMKDAKAYLYLFGIMAVSSTLVPLMESVFDLKNPAMVFPFAALVVFYPLMGHFLANLFPAPLKENAGKYIAVIVGTLLVSVLNFVMNLHSFRADGSLAYTQWFLYIYACGLFVWMRYACRNMKKGSFFLFCGSGVFGTYLIETQLKDLLHPLEEILSRTISEYPAKWIVLLLCMFLGFGLINLLKLIPFVKKYL